MGPGRGVTPHTDRTHVNYTWSCWVLKVRRVKIPPHCVFQAARAYSWWSPPRLVLRQRNEWQAVSWRIAFFGGHDPIETDPISFLKPSRGVNTRSDGLLDSSRRASSTGRIHCLTLDPVGVLYRAAIFVQSLSQVSLKARKKPAVDRNRRPSDRRRIVRSEKQNGSGDLLRLNQPTKWMSLRQLGQMGLWIWR